jgi:hypothetical protein
LLKKKGRMMSVRASRLRCAHPKLWLHCIPGVPCGQSASTESAARPVRVRWSL